MTMPEIVEYKDGIMHIIKEVFDLEIILNKSEITNVALILTIILIDN